MYPICPSCGQKKMQLYGRRWRLVILPNGQKVHFSIRRLRCTRCLKIHHELPDFIIPHKHFAALCLIKALQKKDDVLFCENSTIYRWCRWYLRLCETTLISSLFHSPEVWLSHLVLTLFQKEKSNQPDLHLQG
ncbi:DUF6431 domain-containing protein [Anaerotruncus rubiinfantis]|uniref:DUF6431 domain-containing protein n=1 Tax=Anaerotruncus rubiinfantis TaxID=1720200 RepID=UPI003C2EE903